MPTRFGLSLIAAGGLLLPPVSAEPVAAQAPPGGVDELREWPVEWGGRTRDPYVSAAWT